MTRARAPNLADDDIVEIVFILDGWSGKLSWELLIQAIQRRRHVIYTRQALHKHERIKQAFSLRKRLLSEAHPGLAPKADSPELQAALERIARLVGENARLNAENNALLAQFACWAYNAHTRGLDNDFLSRPLPTVNRGQTRTTIAKPHRDEAPTLPEA
jgi:hypothetical protein